MGEVKVPQEAYYGVQTQWAVENFRPIQGGWQENSTRRAKHGIFCYKILGKQNNHQGGFIIKKPHPIKENALASAAPK